MKVPSPEGYMYITRYINPKETPQARKNIESVRSRARGTQRVPWASVVRSPSSAGSALSRSRGSAIELAGIRLSPQERSVYAAVQRELKLSSSTSAYRASSLI